MMVTDERHSNHLLPNQGYPETDRDRRTEIEAQTHTPNPLNSPIRTTNNNNLAQRVHIEQTANYND